MFKPVLKLSNYIDGLPLNQWHTLKFPDGFSCSSQSVLKLVLVVLCALIVLLLQYLFQELDNNRLLSWQWVMDRRTILSVFSMSAVGMVLICPLCVFRFNTRCTLFMLLAGSCLICMYSWSLPEFMIDSARYLAYAKFIESYGVVGFLSAWGQSIVAWSDLPLIPVIYGVMFSVFGESREVIQLLNTLFFSSTVYVVYLTGKELWQQKVGIYAACFLLAMPFLHVQSSQLMIDVASMCLVSCAVLTSLLAIKRNSIAWAVAAAFTIVSALLSKYSAWIVLLSLLVIPYVISNDRQTENKCAKHKPIILIVLLSSVLLSILYYFYQDLVIRQIGLLFDYQLPGLQRWQESFISSFFYQVHPFASLAAISSIFIALKTKDRRLLLPVLALFLMLIMGINRARYLLIVFPFLALLAAYAVSQIHDELLANFIPTSALIVSLVISLFANVIFLQGSSAVNMKHAGEYINRLAEQDIAVVILPQSGSMVNPQIVLPMIDYFTKKNIYSFYKPQTLTAVQETAVSTSALRFTWEIEYSAYAEIDQLDLLHQPVIAVVGSQTNQLIPESIKQQMSAYQLDRAFDVTDKVFRFQTLISLYRYKGHSY